MKVPTTIFGQTPSDAIKRRGWTSARPSEDGIAALKHVKARHSEMTDLKLRADLSVRSFTPGDAVGSATGQNDLLAQAQMLFKASGTK